ncbi:hypothetical protein [Halapricum sp. CBA1109]|nr:hypothetical protein [Halapricum sp. CBA1109]
MDVFSRPHTRNGDILAWLLAGVLVGAATAAAPLVSESEPLRPR